MPISFTVQNGSLAGKKIEFSEPIITFGRRATNMVRFSKDHEPGVSNIHCEVYAQDGGYYVRDLNSSNGTFVDGQRISAPTRLVHGTVFHLGENGPELVVTLPIADSLPGRPVVEDDHEHTMMMDDGQMAAVLAKSRAEAAAPGSVAPPRPPAPATVSVPPPDMARPVPPAQVQPLSSGPNLNAPVQKDGIGMMTLMTKLNVAKEEVRMEYDRRTRRVYILCAVVLVVAIAAAVAVKLSGDKQIHEMQAQQALLLLQLDKSKQDSENRYNEIKKDAEASTQTKLEKLKSLFSERAADIENMAKDAKKIGSDSKAVSQELLRNREALQAIQSQIGELTAFVSFNERNSKCVYSLVLKFTEGGVVNYKFVGSAFSLNAERGLLGTTARVAEVARQMQDESKCQFIARCNGDAQFSFLVDRIVPHPGFNRNDSGIGKDVALLVLNTKALKPDGTFGDPLTLPAALQTAPDEELDQVVSGVNVAVFGFSNVDHAKLEGDVPVTGVATLSTNIVDGTFSFSGAPVKGHMFDVLKHNCAVMQGFAGAPVVNTKNHVVGVQSNSITLAATRGGFAIPAPNSASAINIRALQELQEQFLKGPEQPK